MSHTKAAVIRSAALLGLKVGAFTVTGSAALMASMLDSFVDVAASLIAHVVKPKDHHEEHQLALIQAFWIFAGGVVVLAETFKAFNEPVDMAFAGVAILAITLVVDASIVRKLSKDKNPVVIGLSEDIKADMTNSAGGLIALTAIAIGAPMYVDKLMAIVISVFLIMKGVKLFHDNMTEATIDHDNEHPDYEEGVGETYV
jgi:divalent metal cation (Fe/Co/Zn/Cd) transporter